VTATYQREGWQLDILADLAREHPDGIPVRAYPIWWLRDWIVTEQGAIKSFGRQLVNGETGRQDWYLRSLARSVEHLRWCEAELERRKRELLWL
jgi:hypothetical protein